MRRGDEDKEGLAKELDELKILNLQKKNISRWAMIAYN